MDINIYFSKYKEVLKGDEYEKFLEYCAKPLRKSIRVNTLKISIDDFLDIAKWEWWMLSQIPWCKEGFWIDRNDKSIPLGNHFLHLWWYFYIQEASSMIPVSILEPEKWDKILDISAAPWSKTTQIASYINDNWLIIANEPSSSRIKAIVSNFNRLWVSSSIITNKDWRVFSQYFPNYFDKILVDAPCTWEWTIRKDKYALDNINEKAIQKMSILQKMLIEEAFHSLKPWWVLVYSTCTLDELENEDAILFLLEAYPEIAELVPIKQDWIKNDKNVYWCDWVLRVWPHDYDTEWFFVAKIKKKGDSQSVYFEDIKSWKRKSPYLKISKLSKKIMIKDLCKSVEEGGDMHSSVLREIGKIEWNLFENWHEIYFRPNKSEQILSKISWYKTWIYIWKIILNKKIDWSHEWILFIEKLFNLNGLELNLMDIDDTLYQKFIKWADIENKSSFKSGICIFKYKWVSVWFWKIIWSRIKNKFPREFIQK